MIKWSVVDHATLLYFFCDNKDDRQNNAVVILWSLLYQILYQHPNVIKYLLDDYEKQKNQLFSSLNMQQSL